MTETPTWDAGAVKGWRDRIGGILIRHEDGTEVYLQPGDDANDLADTLDSPGITSDNIGVLLCDMLEGQEPPSETVRAAQVALDAHHKAYRLEDGNGSGTALFHLLASLLEWCDAQTPCVDFDAILEEVRQHFAENDPS